MKVNTKQLTLIVYPVLSTRIKKPFLKAYSETFNEISTDGYHILFLVEQSPFELKMAVKMYSFLATTKMI